MWPGGFPQRSWRNSKSPGILRLSCVAITPILGQAWKHQLSKKLTIPPPKKKAWYELHFSSALIIKLSLYFQVCDFFFLILLLFSLWVYVKPLSSICPWLSTPPMGRIQAGLQFPSSHRYQQWQTFFSFPSLPQTLVSFSHSWTRYSYLNIPLSLQIQIAKAKPDTFPEIQLHFCNSQAPVKRQKSHQLFPQRELDIELLS